VDIKEIGHWGVDWIEVDQEADYLPTLANTVMGILGVS
jgi:hypothetical protein